MNELDYTDNNGRFHLMCACGHHVSGDVKSGDKILLCPNCNFQLRCGKEIEIVYPELVPDGVKRK